MTPGALQPAGAHLVLTLMLEAAAAAERKPPMPA